MNVFVNEIICLERPWGADDFIQVKFDSFLLIRHKNYIQNKIPIQFAMKWISLCLRPRRIIYSKICYLWDLIEKYVSDGRLIEMRSSRGVLASLRHTLAGSEAHTFAYWELIPCKFELRLRSARHGEALQDHLQLGTGINTLERYIAGLERCRLVAQPVYWVVGLLDSRFIRQRPPVAHVPVFNSIVVETLTWGSTRLNLYNILL